MGGGIASVLFATAIVGTGLLAVPVLAGSAAYALAGGMGWRGGLRLSVRAAPRFYAVMALAMLLGVTVQLAGLPPIRALFLASVVNGLVAPVVLGIVLFLAASSAVLGHRREVRWVRVALTVGILASVAVPVAWLLASIT